MIINDPLFGSIDAPDDATPDEINATLTPYKQQYQQHQSMLRGIGALGQAVQGAFAPAPQMFPKVSGAAAMAMGGNWQNFNQNWQQSANRQATQQQSDQRNALQERQLVQQALQSERDRSNKLKLAEMTQRNQDRTAAMQQAQYDRSYGLQQEQAERDKQRLINETTRLNQPDISVLPNGVVMQKNADGSLVANVNPVIAGRYDEIEAQQNQYITDRQLQPNYYFQNGQAVRIDPRTGQSSAQPVPGYINADEKGPLFNAIRGMDPSVHASVQHWSQENNLDPDLVYAVIMAESDGKNGLTSPAGAQGLMQLMPGTGAGVGVHDPWNPDNNIMGGTKYLAQQIQTFGNLPNALAAYNAGPGNVKKYGGIPPFDETQNYVQKVLGFYNELKGANNSSGARRPIIRDYVDPVTGMRTPYQLGADNQWYPMNVVGQSQMTPEAQIELELIEEQIGLLKSDKFMPWDQKSEKLRGLSQQKQQLLSTPPSSDPAQSSQMVPISQSVLQSRSVGQPTPTPPAPPPVAGPVPVSNIPAGGIPIPPGAVPKPGTAPPTNTAQPPNAVYITTPAGLKSLPPGAKGVTTPEELAALPPGTTIMTDDGKVGVITQDGNIGVKK